jgi:hypothetical protein
VSSVGPRDNGCGFVAWEETGSVDAVTAAAVRNSRLFNSISEVRCWQAIVRASDDKKETGQGRCNASNPPHRSQGKAVMHRLPQL